VREFNTTSKTRSNKFDVEGKRPIFKVSKRVTVLRSSPNRFFREDIKTLRFRITERLIISGCKEEKENKWE